MKVFSHLCLLPLIISFFLTNPSISKPTRTLQTYIVHIDPTKLPSFHHSFNISKHFHQETILHSLPSQPSPVLLYLYTAAISGFAAKLTQEQLSSLRNLDGFISAHPDELLSLHTTHSPQFLGLRPGRGLWSLPNLAGDVIIGVVDTGVWPEHVAFDDSGLSDIPKRWKGACEEGTRFSTSNCNKKLIGARVFYKGYEAVAGKINASKEFLSARDPQGHGTHTASTAGGGAVAGANTLGFGEGEARGMHYTARISAYKACWRLGCASSDILAAVDYAIADGVDVLSLSLGAAARPYYADDIAVAAFGAVERGVFVSTSAGNSGPVESTVSNTAPWMMTVAASYLDRRFPTLVKFGNGRSFIGASLFPGGPTKQLPIAYGDTSLARYCLNRTLSPEIVKGKIVLCDRGINGRTEKGEVVKLAGGAGMLLLNGEQQGEELFADAHVLPASSLGTAAAAAIRGYFASSNRPTASISFLGTACSAPAPIMTAFSSRGPNVIGPDVIKPDVTAPGMSILAAWPPNLSPSLLESDERRVDFNILSGTSMSCPHVTGIAALIKSAHPDWSPAAIKSALMTTAYTRRTMNGSTPFAIIDVSTGLPATPFAFGSGHVDPERAANPGLVYDIAASEYLRYLCGRNYSSEQVSVVARKAYDCSVAAGGGDLNLNYPSFSVLFDGGRGNATAVHRRTVTNVGPGACNYVVEIREPEGVAVTVIPSVLAFAKAGKKKSYKVRFVGVGMGDSGLTAFGDIVWVCGALAVRSPIAVAWQ